MSNNKSNAIVWLLLGVCNFLIFAYDVQNDRDFWTWLWLLNSQLQFMYSFRYFLKYDKEK